MINLHTKCIFIILLFIFTNLIICKRNKLKLPKEIREVFQLHKYYRNSIRFCKIPGQPPAKYLSKLKWNKHLAEKAQITADRCDYAYDSPSDMRFDEFSSVAQNIADSPTIEKAVASWFVEHKNYTYDDNTCKDTCMQYKQLVRGDETEIGCGVKKCKKSYVVVCNYSPA
ncbi:Venom allergen 5 [Schistosoma japonicum]|uniref:Venom allergen 5 n=1 Tax=Schistosoma japonicum TaxID=6182 RepID=A0A4Z2CRR6_SCHJA|nr:Venom allergen 5 [Schistosoma japonicum]